MTEEMLDRLRRRNAVVEAGSPSGARMNNVDASDADQLTAALFEGRHRQCALLDMIRAEMTQRISCVALAHALGGAGNTARTNCLHRLLASKLMSGKDFAGWHG